MTPRIHVTTEDSWICRTLAEHLSGMDGFRVRVTKAAPHDAELTYFVTYLFKEWMKPAGRCVALFTHYIPGKHQRRYDTIARQVEHCVVLSEQHHDYLSNLVGPNRVSRVHLPVARTEEIPKLKVGWFHRSPPGYDNRKRTDLLDVIEKLPWVEVYRSDGEWTQQQLHARMHEVDVFLCTSDYEAGPVSFLEALTLGKHTVIPVGVGLANEYVNVPGVHLFKPGDATDLTNVLARIYEPLKARYEAVAKNTVENWRLDHAAIFRRMLG